MPGINISEDTITHNNEEFTITYTEHLICGDCNTIWEITTPNDPDEDHRSEPVGNTFCPECGTSHGHTYQKETHYYTKTSAIPLTNPPLAVEPHAESLRQLAREFEALDANDWELTESDGTHITFEKNEIESTDTSNKVTDTLK